MSRAERHHRKSARFCTWRAAMVIAVWASLSASSAHACQSWQSTDSLLDIDPGELARHNQQVSDHDLEEWLLIGYRHDPEKLSEWRSKLLEQRSETIRDLRRSYVLPLPCVRGMSEQERLQLDMMARLAGEKSIRLREARKQLPTLSESQLINIRHVCERLSRGQPSRSIRHVPTPPEFEYLKPDLIRVNTLGCEIYLQKGIGQGYGLSVTKGSRQWTISVIDDYEDWTRRELMTVD